MSQMRYDLVILRHTSEKRVEDLVQELLKLLNKANDPYLEYKLSEALLFEQNNNAVLDEIDEEQGRYFQEEFRKLQVETELRPTLQLVTKETKTEEEPSAIYTCPACSHEQPRQPGDAMNTCDQCGVVGEKFARIKKREKVYQSEKRKLEQSQTSEMQEALQRAKYEEEENLRNDARERLGIKKKNNVANVLVGLAAVAAMGVASYFIADTLRTGGQSPEAADTDEVLAESDQDPKDKQPLITIQGGSGNIVVNNGSPSSEGSGGPEGTQSDVNASDEQTAQIAQGQDPAGEGSNVIKQNSTENIQTSTNTSSGQTTQSATNTQPNNQDTAQNRANTPATQQLAALNTVSTSATQNQISHAFPNPVALIPQNKPFQVDKQSEKHELDLLQSILEPDSMVRPRVIQATDAQQLNEQHKQLGRLLKLGKTELAIVFAETVGDPYTASQLLVEIARHESQQGKTDHNSDLQSSIKKLEENNKNNWLLSNNTSQIYDLTGDSDSARTILSNTLQRLKADTITPSQQRVSTLVQMALDRSLLSSNNEFMLILRELNESIQSLPKEEHLAIGRACTLMAHTAFAEDNFGAAKKWLQRVPALDARDKLLGQLDDMKIKLITKLHQNKK